MHLNVYFSWWHITNMKYDLHHTQFLRQSYWRFGSSPFHSFKHLPMPSQPSLAEETKWSFPPTCTSFHGWHSYHPFTPQGSHGGTICDLEKSSTSGFYYSRLLSYSCVLPSVSSLTFAVKDLKSLVPGLNTPLLLVPLELDYQDWQFCSLYLITLDIFLNSSLPS